MQVATLELIKNINWNVTATDPVVIALQHLPGWSIVHPLARLPRPLRDIVGRIRQIHTGAGNVVVSSPVLLCVVPDEQLTVNIDSDVFDTMRDLLIRLRHVSRQATMPGKEDVVSFHCGQIEAIEPFELKPYIGEVYFPDESLVATAVTMEMASKAGKLPKNFEAPIYETIFLDSLRARKEGDFRSAIMYAGMAIEILAGTVLDNEHQRLLDENSATIRIVRNPKSGRPEDPVYQYIRRQSRFPELLHELPMYVLGRSLQLDDPGTYKDARRLYTTRNKLAHCGKITDQAEVFAINEFGATDGLICATKVFNWFGIDGPWHVPYAAALEEWRLRKTSETG